LRTVVARCVSSNAFEIVTACLILTNAAFMGMEVNHMATNRLYSPPLGFQIVNWTYSFLFLVELLLRIFAEGCEFFHMRQKVWNVFDTFVVLCSIIDFILDLVMYDNNEGVNNAKLVRIGRIARTLRVYRSIRIASVVRFLSALQSLIHSIVATLKSLVWACILMVLIVYIFGIVFTQAASNHLLREDDNELMEYWGTIGASMLTLYESVTGGLNWHDPLKLLARMHWIWASLFLIYVSFVFFAVLNVVTGVFCQSAIETARRDPEMILHSLAKEQKWQTRHLLNLFNALDVDGNGKLTIIELERSLEKESVQAQFIAMDLEVPDAWSLFKLLAKDCTHLIAVDEFVDGCMRLKGAAKNIDLAIMKLENEQILKTIAKLTLRVENELLTDNMKSRDALERLVSSSNNLGRMEERQISFRGDRSTHFEMHSRSCLEFSSPETLLAL